MRKTKDGKMTFIEIQCVWWIDILNKTEVIPVTYGELLNLYNKLPKVWSFPVSPSKNKCSSFASSWWFSYQYSIPDRNTMSHYWTSFYHENYCILGYSYWHCFAHLFMGMTAVLSILEKIKEYPLYYQLTIDEWT